MEFCADSPGARETLFKQPVNTSDAGIVMAMPAAELTPGRVAERLRADDTQAPTLKALEELPPPVPRDLALAAAPALVDVGSSLSGANDRDAVDRCGLLLARLFEEAAPDPSSLYAAACGGERAMAWFAPRLIVEATQRALGTGSDEEGQPLTREDAYSYVCLGAFWCPYIVRGLTANEAAAGRTVMEFLRTVRALAVLLLLFIRLPSP